VLAAVQVLEKMDLNKQFNNRSQKQSTEGTVAKKIETVCEFMLQPGTTNLLCKYLHKSTGMRRAVQNIF
jgi:hypothetical protein